MSICLVSICLVSICLRTDKNIGQGGMVDDWWQSAPGKMATPFEMGIGWGSAAIFMVNTVHSQYSWLEGVCDVPLQLIHKTCYSH